MTPPEDKPALLKRKPRDLNAEVASAFGASMGTEIPKPEEPLGSEDDPQRPVKEGKGSLAERGDREA
jgi:hypothetical protein